MPTPQHEPEGPVGPLDYTYTVDPDGAAVTLHPRSPALAGIGLTLTYDGLSEIEVAMRKAQSEAKYREERTGGL